MNDTLLKAGIAHIRGALDRMEETLNGDAAVERAASREADMAFRDTVANAVTRFLRDYERTEDEAWVEAVEDVVRDTALSPMAEIQCNDDVRKEIKTLAAISATHEIDFTTVLDRNATFKDAVGRAVREMLAIG